MEAEQLRDELSDRLRLMLLLDACEAADIAPVPLMRLHALAFLANVLSPIWSVRSYDGKILKQRGGPFYPELQQQLDRLVGLGFVSVSAITRVEQEGRWRLDGSFALNVERAQDVLALANAFSAERETIGFLRRLVFGISRLREPLEKNLFYSMRLGQTHERAWAM